MAKYVTINGDSAVVGNTKYRVKKPDRVIRVETLGEISTDVLDGQPWRKLSSIFRASP